MTLKVLNGGKGADDNGSKKTSGKAPAERIFFTTKNLQVLTDLAEKHFGHSNCTMEQLNQALEEHPEWRELLSTREDVKKMLGRSKRGIPVNLPDGVSEINPDLTIATAEVLLGLADSPLVEIFNMGESSDSSDQDELEKKELLANYIEVLSWMKTSVSDQIGIDDFLKRVKLNDENSFATFLFIMSSTFQELNLETLREIENVNSEQSFVEAREKSEQLQGLQPSQHSYLINYFRFIDWIVLLLKEKKILDFNELLDEYLGTIEAFGVDNLCKEMEVDDPIYFSQLIEYMRGSIINFDLEFLGTLLYVKNADQLESAQESNAIPRKLPEDIQNLLNSFVNFREWMDFLTKEKAQQIMGKMDEDEHGGDSDE